MTTDEKTAMYIANCKCCLLAETMKDCKNCLFAIGLIEREKMNNQQGQQITQTEQITKES